MTNDPHSLASFSAVITHSHLNWTIDFDSKCIHGFVTHKFEAKKDTTSIKLDTNELNVKCVVLDNIQLSVFLTLI